MKQWKAIRKTLNGSCYITRLNELGHMVTTRISRQQLNELIKEISYENIRKQGSTQSL